MAVVGEEYGTQQLDNNQVETITSRIAGVQRTENENITYSKSIKIDSSNINKLGLSDDNIVTHFMDKNGTMTINEEGMPYTADFPEDNPNDFLQKFGFSQDTLESINTNLGEQLQNLTDITNLQDQIKNPVSFLIERVDIDNEVVGYFIYNELEEFGDVGLYLGLDAIDINKMSDDLRQELLSNPVNEMPSPNEYNHDIGTAPKL